MVVAKCFRNDLFESLQRDSKGFAKAAIKFDKLKCERHEGGDIEQNEHRLRIECEKACPSFCPPLFFCWCARVNVW